MDFETTPERRILAYVLSIASWRLEPWILSMERPPS